MGPLAFHIYIHLPHWTLPLAHAQASLNRVRAARVEGKQDWLAQIQEEKESNKEKEKSEEYHDRTTGVKQDRDSYPTR